MTTLQVAEKTVRARLGEPIARVRRGNSPVFVWHVDGKIQTAYEILGIPKDTLGLGGCCG